MRGIKPKLVIDNGAVRTVPRPPAWLSKDAAAEWRRVLPIIVERRILTTADFGSLENYCVAIGHVREAERHVQEYGLVVEAIRENGEAYGWKKNPSVGVVAEATCRARLLAAELGLTPVSRSRPSIRDDGDDDDLLDG